MTDKSLRLTLGLSATLVALAIIISTIFPFIAPRLGLASGYGYGMMGSGMMGGFGMGWMSIFWIVVLGLIIWAVVAAARGTGWSGNSDSGNRSESALGILKRRYARGEINKEEFEERKKDLI